MITIYNRKIYKDCRRIVVIEMAWSWGYGAAYCTPMEFAIVDAVAVAIFAIWWVVAGRLRNKSVER